VIANMGYRLGTEESPAYPKQLEDISLVINMLQTVLPQNVTFAIIGGSAGAHLGMLYSYALDRDAQQVKVVVSHVGPVDFTHPSYSANPFFATYFFNLVGPCRYSECPEMYSTVSPATWISEKSAKTIGFYGNVDLLIPNAQMPILRDKLTQAGVTNKFTVYNAGHGNWVEADVLDEMAQIIDFFNEQWN
jgi:acetyl esterase/lipase